jgi:hypothetical protein
MTNNGDGFKQRFTRIEGLSSIRRLPVIGKIRLGIRIEGQKKNKKTGEIITYTHPKETDYFVCPPEVKAIYGNEPKQLNVMFPMNDPEVLFPQSYKWWGSTRGLKCHGNGVTASRRNEETGEWEERKCPCELYEQGKCKQRASLFFLLPNVKMGGLYQIDFSSYHGIVDVNSGFEYALSLLGEKIAMIPFVLQRVKKETHNDGKKQIHYPLVLHVDVTLEQSRRIREGSKVFALQDRRYEIEAPKATEEENPAYNNAEEDDFDYDHAEEREAEEREDDFEEVEEQKPEPVKAEKAESKDPVDIKIYQTAMKKGLKNWEDILLFAFRTNVYDAQEPLTIEQFRHSLKTEPGNANALLKKINLVTAKADK